MDATQLLLISISLYGLNALAALVLKGSGQAARWTGGVLGVLAAVAGIISAGIALVAAATSAVTPLLPLFQIEPFGWLALELDALSAFLIGIITLVSVGTTLYSLASARDYGIMGFFTNLFLAAMLLVVSVNNAFYFLLFWELMTLAAYVLVVWDYERKEAVRAGYIFMLVAHAGAILILFSFLILFQKTGSFDFGSWRSANLTPTLKNLIFILALIGFGAKAGMAPLHFWAPEAYSVAPSHATALMAGVMKKVAIYGLLRVCIDLLGAETWLWGGIILAFGAFSTILGVFYALVERDVKRMLAYSSVENVGIILMGIGLGAIGMAIQQPALAFLGFLAALYHMINHAFFKGLLFLGSGAVVDQVGTHDLNRMGGLRPRMPWTALAFLTGALAVSAIPPFNGFVSEWFLYQSFFSAGQGAFMPVRVIGPLCAFLLSLAGAFAVMVYIKAYGGAFTGPVRNPATVKAKEAPGAALAGMAYLALGCLVLGLGAPVVAPLIGSVAAGVAQTSPLPVSNGWQVFPGEPAQAVLSPPLVAILLVGLLSVPLLLVVLYGGRRAGRRSGVEPWSCGYGYAAPMSVTASSFDQPVRVPFSPLYRLRTLLEQPFRAISVWSHKALSWIARAEPVVENVVTKPTVRLVETAGQWIQSLQTGDIRVYCLYIILTLAILLIFLWR